MLPIPSRITSDNPKCFAIEASKYEPLLNPVFERWAGHCGVTVECLPPADPEKKGKVERLMPFVRRLYEAHGNEWQGFPNKLFPRVRELLTASVEPFKHGLDAEEVELGDASIVRVMERASTKALRHNLKKLVASPA